MKAILLVRVSADTQNLDEQTLNLINHASKKGYTKNNLIIIEDKESAIKLDEFVRKGLNIMKDHIANDSSINAVFVWELSRLFRKQKTGYSLREYFISNQIQLYCYSPNFQLLVEDKSEVDGSGSITFALYAEMADAEMRNKKARFHRSKVRNARTAKFSGGFVKFGYYIDDNGYYQTDEEKAELIREIFNRYEQGISIFKLTKELLERGKVSTQNFVRNTLISEEYTGKYTGEFATDRIKEKDKKLQRNYPQIISREQFLKCKKIAKNNNKRADKTNEIYYCKKLIKCTECGTHYIGMKSGLIYLCYGRYGKEAKLNPENACKNSPSININVLDSLIWDVVKGEEMYRLNSGDESEIKELKKQILIVEEKIVNTQNKIGKVDGKFDRHYDAYINGDISKEKYESIKKNIKDSVEEDTNKLTHDKGLKAKYEKRIKDLSTSLSLLDTINNKSDYLDSLSDDSEKYEIIKRHVKEINILEDVRNMTKIVEVFFYNQPFKRFKIYLKKKPAVIKYDSTVMYNGELPSVWIIYPLEIEQRFIRKKQSNKTS